MQNNIVDIFISVFFSGNFRKNDGESVLYDGRSLENIFSVENNRANKRWAAKKYLRGTGWDLFRIIARDFLFSPNRDTKKKHEKNEKRS